ncbi:MAG: hypothetical protein O7C39_01965, partial [Bacteroidetes bacterium]|nr:hypothetical protein [Bacteroidota bacterium]
MRASVAAKTVAFSAGSPSCVIPPGKQLHKRPRGFLPNDLGQYREGRRNTVSPILIAICLSLTGGPVPE